MFSKAKEGDRVWSMMYGWGTVINVDLEDPQYQLHVGFGDEQSDWFLRCGRSMPHHLNPLLFWDEVKITPPEKPLPDLKVDTPVLVRDSDDEEWCPRHFHSFGKDGRIRAWTSGCTRHTAGEVNNHCAWNEWKLADEE